MHYRFFFNLFIAVISLGLLLHLFFRILKKRKKMAYKNKFYYFLPAILAGLIFAQAYLSYTYIFDLPYFLRQDFLNIKGEIEEVHKSGQITLAGHDLKLDFFSTKFEVGTYVRLTYLPWTKIVVNYKIGRDVDENLDVQKLDEPKEKADSNK